MKQVDIPVRSIQSAQSEPVLNRGFSIKNIDLSRDDEPKSQPLHRHDFYYLLIISNGSGTHSIDFKKHTVNDGSIFIMKPGQVHEHTLLPDSEGCLIAFNTDFYPFGQQPQQKKALRKACQVNHATMSENNFIEIRQIVEQLKKEFGNKEADYEESIRSYLSILITSFNRSSEVTKDGLKPGQQHHRLEELQELIEVHLTESKKVSYYADLMSLTPFQLNKLTKNGLGKTCSELIAESVILESKRLLLATNHQVNEIAYKLGYEDPAYFIRFFRKHTHYSPQAFREQV